MTLKRPPGLWVAPFVVDGAMHVFPLDPLKADTGVGGWLNARSTCRDATIEAGAHLATKADAFHHLRFCPGCWAWLLGHVDCQVIYAPEPGASIAEPEAVAARDLAELGWFVS
jgi:hypothetical protein